jgi:hypothetical protein
LERIPSQRLGKIKHDAACDKVLLDNVIADDEVADKLALNDDYGRI